MRLVGGMSYLKATLSGKAQPNPLSWLLWGITPMIAFAAEIKAGVGLPALVTFALGLSPLLVFVSVMHKNPKLFHLDGLNVICAIVAIAGIVLWRTTANPLTAIVMALLADFVSAMPTIRKTWLKPFSEYRPGYFISACSMIITLLTIKNWTFATYAFPVYILLINFFLVGFISYARYYQFKYRKRTKSRTRKRRPKLTRTQIKPKKRGRLA